MATSKRPRIIPNRKIHHSRETVLINRENGMSQTPIFGLRHSSDILKSKSQKRWWLSQKSLIIHGAFASRELPMLYG